MCKETQEPLLTVIIYTYNHAYSIEDCIKSVFEQKTDYPFVINIWDDCSTDGTSDICKSYSRKYPDKIKCIVQKKNTFTGSYKKMQSRYAMKSVKTKYWCAIDGDDRWCNENKIQMALDFLENNPEYIGYAHDTTIYNAYKKESRSHVHDVMKYDLKDGDKCELKGDAPFFLISSRIFRTTDYAQKFILPIDYLVYYYHFSKGSIYYHDEQMAVYNITNQSTFAKKPNPYLVFIQAYNIMKMLNFEADDIASAKIKRNCNAFMDNENVYNRLCKLKEIFGVKWGWHVWALLTCVPHLGFECLNRYFIYKNRKATKKEADKYASLAKKFENLSSDEISDLFKVKEDKLTIYRMKVLVLIILSSCLFLINLSLLAYIFLK